MTYRRKQYDVPSQTPAPLLGAVRWINGELQKVETELFRPEVRGVSFEIQQELPERFKEGDLYYGEAGVFGGAAGLYIRDGNVWRKL